MIHEFRTLDFSSIRCASSGHRSTIDDLERTGGRCSRCDAERHDVVLVAVLEGMDVGAMLSERTYYESATGDYDPEKWSSQTTYSLEAVPGTELLAWSGAPVVEALAAIHAYRIAAAKKNLRSDQRVCPVCKSIYTVSRYGARYIDYCSRLCRNAARNGVKHIPHEQIRRTPGTTRQKRAEDWGTLGMIFLVLVLLAAGASC